jgi:uncharacterized Ntn-hydrolase superfamily protein
MSRACLGLLLSLSLLAGLVLAGPRAVPPARAAGDAPAAWPPAEVNTFSIVAYDPDHKEWGVAVASRVLAVGAIVPWAKAGAGAVATQAYTNTSYGSHGLELLAEGKSAEDVIKRLTDADPDKEHRQVGVVDAEGRPARFTGSRCNAWAGSRVGEHYTCQGNLLAGPDVVEAMAKAFEGARGPLAWRLMDALEAGEKAGGDRRGKQSAAILVVKDRAGDDVHSDRFVDLRVDDHDKPVQELARILEKRLRRP